MENAGYEKQRGCQTLRVQSLCFLCEPLAQPAVQDGLQLADINGLCHMLVHAGVHGQFDVFCKRVCCHSHDGDGGCVRTVHGANSPGSLVAVHEGHLYIHED